MGGAASRKRKALQQRKAAIDALKSKRAAKLRFSLFNDVTNLRGDVLDVVPDKEAARALARELRSTLLHMARGHGLRRLTCLCVCLQSPIRTSSQFGGCGGA